MVDKREDNSGADGKTVRASGGASDGVGEAATIYPASGIEDTVASASSATHAAGHDLSELCVVDPSYYTRRHEIARGGVGRIVAARDHRLGRDIAIKELIECTPALEKRFQRELHITAMLQHPAIIAIHEAGRWPDGEIFYTMKHVEGRALNKVIAENETLRQRLALLPHVLAVCDALAYAHARNVVHRDLKPANVLAGAFGETVVIDWGLAKDLSTSDPDDLDAAGSDQAADDGLTMIGQAMGTPAFMPPEQARGEQVDERADVYALGAILYCLLAGRMPYQDTNPTSAQEVLSRVKAGAPTPLPELESDAPADLQTIVAKAMAREPSDRYRHAGELAEELRRFETGQRVSAHDYSTAALVKRWLARHRAPVVVAALMAALLAVGGVVSFVRIASERDRATAQKRAAEANRSDAETNRAEVEELLDFMMVDLRAKLEPVGKLDLLDMVATKAAAYFAERPVDLSRPDEAEKRATAHNNLGDVLLTQGDTAGAVQQYRAALEILEPLAARDPDAMEPQRKLCATRNNLGEVLLTQGDTNGALVQHRAALAVGEGLVARDPRDGRWQRCLAVSRDNVGDALVAQEDTDGALEQYELMLVILERLVEQDPQSTPRRGDLAIGQAKLGGVLLARGNTDGALERYRSALAIEERLREQEPGNSRWQRILPVRHDDLADVFKTQGKVDEALQQYRVALAAREQLVERDPTNTLWQRDLFVSHSMIGEVLLIQGDAGGALDHQRLALATAGRLTKRDPKNTDWQQDLSITHHKVGDLLATAGDADGAMEQYRSSLSVAERLAALDTGNSQWQRGLAVSSNKVGSLLFASGDAAGARQRYQTSLEIAERLVAQNPDNALWQRDLALSYYFMSKVHSASGDDEQARQFLGRSADVFGSYAASASDLYNSACLYALVDRADDAFAKLDKAVDWGFSKSSLAQNDSDLASLHDDQRWKPLLERMKKAD